jgi:hydroxypyruvate reductase
VLRGAYQAALDAAAPERLLPPFLDARAEHSPAVVLGAGKAAAAMAATFRAHWRGPCRGLVVTRYEHGLAAGEDAGSIEVVEAGHPSPDSASVAAGARLLELAGSLGPDERLFFLISGGGSALAAAPLGGIGFDRKRATANFLIRAGADIREINCVRKHLSGLKGGRLAVAAHPAPVVTYAISDVPGDAVADIASGPTVPDRTTQADAIAVLEKYGYPDLAGLRPFLEDPALESPKPGDPAFAGDEVHLIASAATALGAAADFLQQSGYRVLLLGDDLDDEAQPLGREHARLARATLAGGEPVAIVSGGETRVILSGQGGRGGRNLEYLSGLTLELAGEAGIHALAADTDGIDGHGDHAGALVFPGIIALGRERGVRLESALSAHDSYAFFDACGTLIRTGPTRTNVNDFRVILCQPETGTTRP